MNSCIERYLDAAKVRGVDQRYHVVRSSSGQRRHVAFGKWAKRVIDERDVLLDFLSCEPIRIFLNRHRIDYGGGHYKWHFLDHDGKKVGCHSGYEALFVAYLKWNSMPFEYQKWIFARRPTRRDRRTRRLPMISGGGFAENARRWISISANGFGYLPDFYLPKSDEFVELKGWPPEAGQSAVVQYLKRKGYRIRIVEWKELRLLLGFPFLSYNTCLYRAKEEAKTPSLAFADPRWVKECLSAIPARSWRSWRPPAQKARVSGPNVAQRVRGLAARNL